MRSGAESTSVPAAQSSCSVQRWFRRLWKSWALRPEGHRAAEPGRALRACWETGLQQMFSSPGESACCHECLGQGAGFVSLALLSALVPNK